MTGVFLLINLAVWCIPLGWVVHSTRQDSRRNR